MIIYWDKKTNSKNRIGQRVKELRKAHNLTQKTLAAKLQLAGYDFNDLAILRISSRLLFTGNIPRGVFCERRSQKTRDIPREFMRSA